MQGADGFIDNLSSLNVNDIGSMAQNTLADVTSDPWQDSAPLRTRTILHTRALAHNLTHTHT